MKFLFSFFSTLFFAFLSQARLQLPAIFSNDMVLQQNSRIKIWGQSTPNKPVFLTCSWSNTTFQSTANAEGCFSIECYSPAGSYLPQWLTVTNGKEKRTLSNLLIGEIWLCSGQSNMAMTFHGYPKQPVAGQEEIMNRSFDNTTIRSFTVDKNASYTHNNEIKGTWSSFEGKAKMHFSAVAYFYAKHLQNQLKIPVGIINSSYGGSMIEGWLNEENLKKYSEIPLQKNFPDSEAYLRPSVFYYNMIRSLKLFTIKGVLWYQGESNSANPKGYGSKLQDLIFLLRFTFSDLKLPVYLVEIAPYRYGDTVAPAILREEQNKVATSIPHCGIVCTSDLVPLEESNNIHPPWKQPIGERLANLALKKTYFERLDAPESPRFNRYECKGSECVLYFDHAELGLKLKAESSAEDNGFEVADSSRIFRNVEVRVGTIPNTLILQLPEKNFGKLESIRYCFKNYQYSKVFNTVGLPLFPFRTDQWE